MQYYRSYHGIHVNVCSIEKFDEQTFVSTHLNYYEDESNIKINLNVYYLLFLLFFFIVKILKTREDNIQKHTYHTNIEKMNDCMLTLNCL